MSDAKTEYVHGYEALESERLNAQAWSVRTLLHSHVRYAPNDIVLEAGCGTGAQTVTLARNNPNSHIVAIDRSSDSLAQARARVREAGLSNVSFYEADLFDLPFPPAVFDHVFVCFVLEHLQHPKEALIVLRALLKPGGGIVVFEGDHGSTYFHPESAAARAAIASQVELQRRGGGNAMIGRQLYPLLRQAGFSDVDVAPRIVYVDGAHPELIDAFTLRTFTAMIAGVRERVIAAGIIDPAEFDDGIKDLERTASVDGVFSYTFFIGTAANHYLGLEG